MPEIGIPELLIILVIVLILFGPGRLAGAGTALGKALREFREGIQSVAEDKESPSKKSTPQERSSSVDSPKHNPTPNHPP